MECPKCRHQNPDAGEYCLRCHAPLRYTCPACKHVQLTGGQCEKCGVDFAKYAAMLHFQMKTESEQERARLKQHSAIYKQLLLAPLTGGLSLLKYFRSRLRGE
ncbi:MAG: zinc ribbon domain-containing protein [Terriglobia bacterium]